MYASCRDAHRFGKCRWKNPSSRRCRRRRPPHPDLLLSFQTGAMSRRASPGLIPTRSARLDRPGTMIGTTSCAIEEGCRCSNRDPFDHKELQPPAERLPSRATGSNGTFGSGRGSNGTARSTTWPASDSVRVGEPRIAAISRCIVARHVCDRKCWRASDGFMMVHLQNSSIFFLLPNPIAFHQTSTPSACRSR